MHVSAQPCAVRVEGVRLGIAEAVDGMMADADAGQSLRIIIELAGRRARVEQLVEMQRRHARPQAQRFFNRLAEKIGRYRLAGVVEHAGSKQVAVAVRDINGIAQCSLRPFVRRELEGRQTARRRQQRDGAQRQTGDCQSLAPWATSIYVFDRHSISGRNRRQSCSDSDADRTTELPNLRTPFVEGLADARLPMVNRMGTRSRRGAALKTCQGSGPGSVTHAPRIRSADGH